MSTPVTLYLVEDHKTVMDGLKLLISDEASIEIVGCAGDGETAYNEILAKEPDLALVDLRMPGMGGLELIYRLTTQVNTHFIVLSMDSDPRDIRDAMKGGAAGYLLKANTGKVELMNCFAAVLKGRKYFPPVPAAREPNERPVFTPRELDILKLVIEEKTTDDIAAILCLSAHTVATHRKNIARKTGKRTGVGLLLFLKEHQIVL